MKFSGTLLAQTNKPLEIQKADLDLLAKVNQVADIAEDPNPVFDTVSVGGVSLTQMFESKKDPTGFTNNSIIDLSYDSTTRTVTLKDGFVAFWRGKVIPELVTNWTSPPIPVAPTQPWFLYYDGSAFVWSTTSWTFDMLQIAYVYYRSTGTFLFCNRECHGLQEWQTHEELHQAVGTYKLSGGTISNIVLSSTTAANRRPYIAQTTIKDEDLTTINAALTSASYTHAYLSGTTITSTWANADIVPLSGNQPYYNLNTGGVYSQQLMTNNSYMCVWVIAFPASSDADSQRYRFFFLQGQSEGTLINQRALTPQDLNLGGLLAISPEFVFIDKIIIRYQASNWTVEQVDILAGTKLQQSSVSYAGPVYETDVWTPTIYGSVTAGTQTYSVQSGKFTRVGNTVTLFASITVATTASMAGEVRIGGLPYTSGTVSGAMAIGSHSSITGVTDTLCLQVPATATYISMNVVASGSASTPLDASNIAAGSAISFSGTYII